MQAQILFGASVAFGLIVWSIVVVQYAWPYLRDQKQAEALRPLLILHGFRFVGLSFMIPGVVAPDLASAFAVPAAVGDLVAAILALLALWALPGRLGILLTWIFNIWGTADLLFAFYQGNEAGMLAGQLGAGFYIITVLVPLLLVTHVLVFRVLLLRR
jgi:hypothetical protein